MAEAIISRSSAAAETVVPVTPGYHTILVTLKDLDGLPMVNRIVSCKDNKTYYNYTTNEKGQAIFAVNSGYANIFVNNYFNDIQFLDILPIYKNIDAPVGLTSKINLTFDECNKEYYEFTANKKFALLKKRNANLIICGGGGGGGYFITQSGQGSPSTKISGGGAGGYLNQYNNITLGKRVIYNFIVGIGGAAGTYNRNNYKYVKGNTGGTSYIVNTEYSAIGGNGGNTAYFGTNLSKAVGGLGNGAYYTWATSANGGTKYWNGTNSSVDFAGGGGGLACEEVEYDGEYDYSTSYKLNRWGGYPYGGGWKGNNYNGTRGGGGAGGYAGGAGLMRLYIQY